MGIKCYMQHKERECSNELYSGCVGMQLVQHLGNEAEAVKLPSLRPQ